MTKESNRVFWAHLVSMMLSSILALWMVTTPQDLLSVLPGVPWMPLILYLAMGFLVVVIFKIVVPTISLHTEGYIGFIYSSLVWGPFVYAWVVLSMYGHPVWLSFIAALIAPTLLLITAGQRPKDRNTIVPIDPFFAAIRDEGRIHRFILFLTSLFLGCGGSILPLFLYAYVTDHAFGTLISEYLGIVLMSSAALAGGIFGRTQSISQLTDFPSSS